MADFEIELSYAGIGEMLNSDFMVAEMGRRAALVRAHAEGTAPVYDGKRYDPHRGQYKESFSDGAFPFGGIHHDRAEGWVENSAPHALYVEYGNRGAEPHHTMLRALAEGAGDIGEART
jgi:hypothetical protein